jgi:hypothetical protein
MQYNVGMNFYFFFVLTTLYESQRTLRAFGAFGACARNFHSVSLGFKGVWCRRDWYAQNAITIHMAQ